MYIPATYKMEDVAEKIAFMRRYSFATIITSVDNVPLATQLPFYVDDSSGTLHLRSHFAAVNPQARHIAANTSLVLFTEPHAYISPSHYNKFESVPTWDYIAVHAYGTATILEEEEAKAHLLEQMISQYEPAYQERWNSLSEKYKTGMIRGITAFDLTVTSLQGQKKLSQNKTIEERERIIHHLEKNGTAVEQDLAAHIRNLPQ